MCVNVKEVNVVGKADQSASVSSEQDEIVNVVRRGISLHTCKSASSALVSIWICNIGYLPVSHEQWVSCK